MSIAGIKGGTVKSFHRGNFWETIKSHLKHPTCNNTENRTLRTSTSTSHGCCRVNSKAHFHRFTTNFGRDANQVVNVYGYNWLKTLVHPQKGADQVPLPAVAYPTGSHHHINDSTSLLHS